MNKSVFRKRTKEIKQLHVSFVSEIRENKDIIVPIPEEITMTYEIEVGDAVVFEIKDDVGIVIHFVPKKMWTVTEKYEDKKKKQKSSSHSKRRQKS